MIGGNENTQCAASTEHVLKHLDKSHAWPEDDNKRQMANQRDYSVTNTQNELANVLKDTSMNKLGLLYQQAVVPSGSRSDCCDCSFIQAPLLQSLGLPTF